VSTNQCEIDLTLPDGYEVCWDFFLITKGGLEEMPRLLGYAPAKIRLERLPNGGRFHVTIPNRTPLLTRFRRAFTWAFAARAGARELQAAHEDLVDRYEQLQQTSAELENYKNNLEQMVKDRTRELLEARDELSKTVQDLSVARDELSETNVQLRDAQGVRERFFSHISHEIRTPLSIILLAANDVNGRIGAALDHNAKASLGAVSDSARKLLRLVDELLMLAAGQEGKLRVYPEATDLVALLKQLEVGWRLTASAAGLGLTVRTPDSLIGDVDPIALERVVSNLVSNGVKYTPKGGSLEIELVEQADSIRLSVFDTGPGISEELASRLFGRFERAGEHRRTVGTGLGLSLVKYLVEAHRGDVAAHPRVGGGSELRVTLPRGTSRVVRASTANPVELTTSTVPGGSAASDQAVAVKPLGPDMRATPQGRSDGTILLAEDDVKLAEMIASVLSDRYTVIVATDGEAALELAKQRQPQLLITDVEMPRMNGIELARKFREVTGDRLAPIVILSAVLDLGTRVAGLEAGAVDYVTKPFDPAELKARVASQFRMRDLALRLHRAEQLSSLAILTSGLAHELRNPANGIVNAIAPLTRLLPAELTAPKSAVGQLLSITSSCAQQIGFLTKHLLSFREGGTALDLRPVQVDELVARALELASDAVKDLEVRKAIEVDRELMCAPPLLVQVLTNLIDNAAHAAGAGGWLEVRAETQGDQLTIEVIDSGPGISPHLHERIFEPFFTTKPPGSGTGLGLPLARSIVHRHNGVLEIRERAGRTAFVVELPLARIPESRSKSDAALSPPAGPA
ncbi:MAG: ATP-binding protein, partial [Kofleriaceae bacterium]